MGRGRAVVPVAPWRCVARCPWRAGWRWPARRCWAWRWNMPRRSGCSAPRCSACWPGGGWGAAVQCAQLDARSGADDVRRHRRRPGHAARRARFRLAHAQRLRRALAHRDLRSVASGIGGCRAVVLGRPRSPMRWCPLASATAGTWCSRSRYAASWAMRSRDRGFFRQYELSVLASTEEDSLRVRTNVRGEDGYLYRVHMPEGGARALFLAYVETANGLARQPRFYNTLTANCITIVYQLARRIVPGLPMDYRLLLSGYLPEYLYRIGGAARSGQRAGLSRRRPLYRPRARHGRRGAVLAQYPPGRARRMRRALPRAPTAPMGAVFILGRPGYENLWSARFLQARRCRRKLGLLKSIRSQLGLGPRSMMRVAPGKPKSPSASRCWISCQVSCQAVEPFMSSRTRVAKPGSDCVKR